MARAAFGDAGGRRRGEKLMPRIEAKKKQYKILDLKGWVVHQAKMNRISQQRIAEALGVSQARVSQMLSVPKDPKDRTEPKIDVFSYGDLLSLFDLFGTSAEEMVKLLTL